MKKKQGSPLTLRVNDELLEPAEKSVDEFGFGFETDEDELF